MMFSRATPIVARVIAAALATGVDAQDVPAFFVKSVDCEGIPIRSSAAVEDRALHIACDKITLMLKFIPPVRMRLIHHGCGAACDRT